MKEIVHQLPSLLELPLPDIEEEVLSTCINRRMTKHGLSGDMDAYEQLLLLDKGEVNLLLCEILTHNTSRLEIEKNKNIFHKEWQEVLKASLCDTLLEISPEYQVLNAWVGSAQILGENTSEFVGKTIQEIFNSGVSSTLETIIDEVLQTKYEQHYEFFDTNEHHWYMVRIVNLPETSGRTNRAILIFKNITLRKTAEKALAVSEHKYKVLVENSPQAIVVHAENRFLFANQMALKLLGAKSFKDLQALQVLDIVVPEEYELVVKRIEDMYSQKRDAPLRRGRFIRLDGITRNAEILGCRIQYEGKPASQIVFRDITAEIDTQKRLQTQERLLKATNDAATHFLTEKDVDSAINHALKAVMEATSASRSYIFENHISEEGDIRLSQTYDATTRGLEPVLDNPAFQNLSYAEIGFEKERSILENGDVIKGRKADFSQTVRELMTLKSVASMVVIPIFIQDKFWGILGLSSEDEDRVWLETEVGILRNFANAIGSFILKRQIEECEQIEYEIANILSVAKDSDDAVKQILENICETLAWDIGEFWVKDQLSEHLNLQYSWYDKNNQLLGEFAHKSIECKYGRNKGIVGQAWELEKAIYCVDYKSKENRVRVELAIAAEICSGLAIPVLLDNEVLGVLYLLSTRRRDLNDIYIRTFTSIGGHIGQFIKRKQVEGHFKDLVDAVPAVVWRLDVDSFAFTYVSHQAEQMLGYPVENWIGNSSFWASRVHPDDKEYALNYCSDCTARKIDHDFEYRMIRKDGEVIWIKDYVHVVVRDGKPVELIGLLIDITSQKQAEEALSLSEERLKLAIDGVELGLWDWNMVDDTVYSSEVFSGMIGYEHKEMPRYFSEMFDWVHPKDKERVKNLLAAHLEGQTSVYQDEFRLKTKAGDWKWVLDIGKVIERDKEGRPIRMLGIHRDIDERKRAEETLRISEERLRLALKGIGICDWNIQRDEIYINDSWKEFLGLNLQTNHTSESYFTQIHPDDINQVKLHIDTHLRGESPACRMEFRMRQGNGTYVWVLNQGEVVEWDEAGNPIRLICTHLDISEIKAYQQKIQELNKELEARVEARTSELKASNQDLESFAYSISHDLRAPLRHINGYSRLLSQRSNQILDENTREFVGFIADASLKLSKQIEDLLQYSRIGRKEIKIEPIDLKPLFERQINVLKRENRNRDITFHVADLPIIKGDSILIDQLFYNLLSNAVKYSRREPHAIIEVGAETNGKYHTFFVKDNGVGFDPAYSHKLFQVFKRLHGESEFEGTGIGLANVYRIVQRHRGKVWGESTPEGGATFYVQLPILKRK